MIALVIVSLSWQLIKNIHAGLRRSIKRHCLLLSGAQHRFWTVGIFLHLTKDGDSYYCCHWHQCWGIITPATNTNAGGFDCGLGHQWWGLLLLPRTPLTFQCAKLYAAKYSAGLRLLGTIQPFYLHLNTQKHTAFVQPNVSGTFKIFKLTTSAL